MGDICDTALGTPAAAATAGAAVGTDAAGRAGGPSPKRRTLRGRGRPKKGREKAGTSTPPCVSSSSSAAAAAPSRTSNRVVRPAASLAAQTGTSSQVPVSAGLLGASPEKVPRWARPTVAYSVRQASLQVEREHRDARIKDRRDFARGKGKQGAWVRPRTAKAPVGIPDHAASTTLAHGGGGSLSSSPTRPMEHNIRVSSPRPGSAPLSVALEPAMKQWGTDWGLRDKPAVPLGNANSTHGVDMSPRKKRRPSAMSPGRRRARGGGEPALGSSRGGGSSTANFRSSGSSSLLGSTRAWVEQQRVIRAALMQDGGHNGGILDAREARDVQEAEEERAAHARLLRRRQRVARASAAIAQRQEEARKGEEAEDEALEKMIASLPELFRIKVRQEVRANRARAAAAAKSLGGTGANKIMKPLGNQQGPRAAAARNGAAATQQGIENKLPVPVVTELYHEAAFQKHLERNQEVRRRKAEQERQYSTSQWAPGHTIVKPFSFDSRHVSYYVCYLCCYAVKPPGR